jgi:3-hydroxyacyl-CoA dehydrogenase
MNSHHQDPSKAHIAIIGGGSIGVGFAIVHARAGHTVCLYDPDTDCRAGLPASLQAILADLAEFGLVAENFEQILNGVEVVDSIEQAVAGSALVHECAPEDLDVKREVVSTLDSVADVETVIASASSAITATEFAAHAANRQRFLVAHPGNPPYLLPVIEIVPAAFTAPAAVDRAMQLLAAAGMSPIRLRREVPGFVFNRLQGALLREAYCLVRDGVAGVDDIDRVVRDGPGLRWAVIGPFETVDLNTRGGIERHARLLGPAYERMGAERGQHDPWTPDLVAKVTDERRQLLPLEQRPDRIRWRDRQLMRLLAARTTDA